MSRNASSRPRTRPDSNHYQVRSWRAWYAHITLSMLALAWLAASKTVALKGEPIPAVWA
ncbi:transposase [Nocardia seriolae]|nr:transposase [Nocardia seriolae]